MTNEPVVVPAEPATRPWVRSSRDARFGGVCSGIARRQHLDPVLVRVLFVLLGLSAGLGFVLYAAAYAFWPDDLGGRPPIERWLPQSRTWTTQRKWVLIAIVALVAMSTLGTALPFTLGPALVVLVAWRVARRQADRSPELPRDEAPVLPQAPLSQGFSAATLAWQQRIDSLDGRWAPTTPATYLTTPAHPSSAPAYLAQTDPLGIYEPVAEPQAPRRSTRPRFIITLLVLLIAAGAAGLAYSVPQAESAWRMAVACALAVIAVALLIGARTGRPRLLVLVGIVLTVVAFLPDTPAGESYSGTVSQAYTNDTLPPSFTVAFADATLDLTGVDVTQSTTLPVMCAASALEIRLPDGVSTTIQYEQVATSLELPGSPPVTNTGSWTSAAGSDHATLTLTLEAVGCEVTVS